VKSIRSPIWKFVYVRLAILEHPVTQVGSSSVTNSIIATQGE